MLRDKTIERRVKARMQDKIAQAQARYDEEKRLTRNAHEAERMRLYEDYLDNLTALNLREDAALEKLEEECVGEACQL